MNVDPIWLADYAERNGKGGGNVRKNSSSSMHPPQESYKLIRSNRQKVRN